MIELMIVFFLDPNDVESPRASFIMPSKYGVTAQTPQLNPNEEDLSLVLGTMQVSRGRSYSTTMTPKVQASETSTPAHAKDISRTTTVNNNEQSKQNVRRKKSVPIGNMENRLVEWLLIM